MDPTKRSRYIPYRRPRGGDKDVPNDSPTSSFDDDQDNLEPDDSFDVDHNLEICAEADEYGTGDGMDMDMAVNLEAEIESLQIFDESTPSATVPEAALYKNNEESHIIQESGVVSGEDCNESFTHIIVICFVFSPQPRMESLMTDISLSQ